MNYYIGIDLGTSSVKLILMDSSGKIRRILSRTYPASYPRSGWSEQNPEDWYDRTMSGLQELLEGADRSRVCGLSLGGQMHGLVALDKDDRVIRPAILWNDGRATAEVEYLNDVVGTDKLSRWTGNIAFAGFTAPKLLWMKEQEPQRFARIAKIMLPKDYLAYRLTGVHCTDPTDASGMLLFDVKNRSWSHEMIEICGIREEMLARVYESFEPVGRLKEEPAGALGLGEVLVAAGAGDNAAAALGTGTVSEGQCNISLGTSGTVFIPCERFIVDGKNALHSFAHADGNYHLMGCILSAASCGKWWLEDILKTDDYAGETASFTGGGKNEVFFLPYLMGERSPHNDACARGLFLGMNMHTTRAGMTQAVYEGVTFALRDSVEIARNMGISPHRSRLCGGGARSGAWRQMAADILNLEMDLLETEEGPALGAAMLAAVACGEYGSVEEAAAQIVRIKETVAPNPEAVETYEARYQFFRELYPAVKELFRRAVFS
ncbi:MAG: xylulokinase [Firmicutes bacterium]|nr:xylulokinase [Bacillota bacterium]